MAEVTMKRIYTEEVINDPYPLFRQIREIDPVYWDEQMGDDGGWMVTGYAPAMAALMDHRMTSRRPHWDPNKLPEDADPSHIAAMDALARQIFVAEPPDHTRIRRQFKRPFLPRSLEVMREQITKTAHRLLDGMLSKPETELDMMEEFGFPLPSITIGRMLGVPPEQDYLPWMLSLGLLLDDGPVSRKKQTKMLGGVNDYLEFFRGQLAERKDGEFDDLMQTLVASYSNGGFASDRELFANLAFILTAGQISTAHQIGSTLLNILRRPELHELLRADPELVSTISPEFLRFDASIQLSKRRVVEPTELGGHELPVGAEVFIWIGAANRDPEQFANPDELDPEREDITHLSFSRGIHYCLGAHLGKMVHDIGVQAFIERAPQPRVLVGDQVPRSIMPTFRGPYKLPMMFGREG